MTDISNRMSNDELELRKWEGKQVQFAAHQQAIAVYATLAINSIILINSAAAGTVLAFIGSMWGKDSLRTIADPAISVLMIFCIGASTAIVCSCLSYLAQYCYGRGDVYGISDADQCTWYIRGNICHVPAILFAGLGISAFLYGVWSGLSNLREALPIIAAS